MRYLSLFSGIEAATVAWEPLGWEPVMQWIGRRIEDASLVERNDHAIEKELYGSPDDEEQLSLF